MKPHLLSALIAFVMSAPLTSTGASPGLEHSRQCIVVLAGNWQTSSGILRSFERATETAKWEERGTGFPVVLGKNGLGQGPGLIELNLRTAPVKKEGDSRAPAGIFRLDSAFGYARRSSATWIKLPYLALTSQIEAVDDSRSSHYNQLVDRSKVARVDWHRAERMRRPDRRYRWGIVVAHNPGAMPDAGSCIFLHVWQGPASSTTGCTAMAEENLGGLLRWLDPTAHPILAQMPRATYRAIRARHHLPPVRE